MMAFAVLAVRPYQKVAAFGLFPALTAAKVVYELIRPHSTASFAVSLEDTLLTVLVFAASIPLVLFLIALVSREVRRTEALRGENRTLKHEVGIDGLTGAWTRRQFGLLWQREKGAAKRSGQPLALAMIDLDRFKRVNDRWGHLTGDQVLSQTAESVQHVLRQGDSLIRWGGDEFVALCPGAGREVALALGAKLVEAVKTDARLMPWKQQISVGIAVWTPDESLETLLSRADQMLYQAKKDGRNRVCATNGSEDFSCRDPDS
jgi:diguanylate cyclase (GGDEF)-like protein